MGPPGAARPDGHKGKKKKKITEPAMGTILSFVTVSASKQCPPTPAVLLARAHVPRWLMPPVLLSPQGTPNPRTRHSAPRIHL